MVNETNTINWAQEAEDKNFALILHHLGLSAGMMTQGNLISSINNLLPKTDSQANLSNGQCAVVLLQRLLSGALPAGLSNISDWAKNLPCNLFALNPMVDGGHASIKPDVLTDFLDRVADYGPAAFVSTVISQLLNNEDIHVLHLDNTDFHFNGVPQSPNLVEISNKAAKQEPAPLPPFNMLSLSTLFKGDDKPTMVYSSAVSVNEDEDELSSYKQFCEQDLAKLKTLFPNLHVIVMDLADDHAHTIKACKSLNIDVITKINNNLVKDDLEQLATNSSKLSSIVNPSNGQAIKYQFLGTQELKTKDGETITVQKCAFISESSRSQKEKTVNKKAEKECEKLQTSLQKLITDPCATEAEALKAFRKITKNIKYCKVSEPKFEPVNGSKGKGKSSKDVSKESVAVKLLADVAIDQELVNQAVEKELFYVVVSTDLDASLNEEWALELYTTYHEQSGIAGCWKDISDTGSVMASIFLENEARIKALFAVITLALFYQRKLMNHVLNIMDQERISLSSIEQKATYRTSWPTFVEYMQNNGPQLIIINDQIMMTNLKVNNHFVFRIAEAIGDEAISFYQKPTYEQKLDEIIKSYESVFK